MFLRIWRFITMFVTSLDLAMAFAHLLQLQPRMSYDYRLWRNSQKMYQNFGPPIGLVIEGGAVLTTTILSLLVLHRRLAARWTWLGASCITMALILWWFLIAPVNARMETWSIESAPPEWRRLRVQWEYTHASRAILMLIGFAALLNSLLAEIPAQATSVEVDRNTSQRTA
jgi:hypothetical protein